MQLGKVLIFKRKMGKILWLFSRRSNVCKKKIHRMIRKSVQHFGYSV